MEEMQNQELCILLESILALLETGNVDRAKEILQNAINRMQLTEWIKDPQPVQKNKKDCLEFVWEKPFVLFKAACYDSCINRTEGFF